MFSPSWIRSQLITLPVPPASSFAGRTYIVTGANNGLGYECSKHLVYASAARVVMAVRSEARGHKALLKIEAETGKKGVAEVWPLDLGDFASVKRFAERAKTELEAIDGIVENASIALSEWTLSEGVETTMAVNVLGTFLLAVLLLPKLRENAIKSGVAPRLTIVGSNIAWYQGPGSSSRLSFANL